MLYAVRFNYSQVIIVTYNLVNFYILFWCLVENRSGFFILNCQSHCFKGCTCICVCWWFQTRQNVPNRVFFFCFKSFFWEQLEESLNYFCQKEMASVKLAQCGREFALLLRPVSTTIMCWPREEPLAFLKTCVLPSKICRVATPNVRSIELITRYQIWKNALDHIDFAWLFVSKVHGATCASFAILATKGIMLWSFDLSLLKPHDLALPVCPFFVVFLELKCWADHKKWKQRQRESRPVKSREPTSAPSCNYSIKFNMIRKHLIL